MLKRLCMTLAFVILTASPALAKYSAVIEDLPLMPQMTEKSEGALIFDKPDGQIAETVAETAAPAADIEKFYAAALPPLGWKKISAFYFIREEEILRISIERKGKKSLVRFSLTPAGKGE